MNYIFIAFAIFSVAAAADARLSDEQSYLCDGFDQKGKRLSLDLRGQIDEITIIVSQDNGSMKQSDEVSIDVERVGSANVYSQVGPSRERNIEQFKFSLKPNRIGVLQMKVSPSGEKNVRATLSCNFF